MSDDSKRTTGEHYVYLYQHGNHILEVVLTGRVATRKKGTRTLQLHEIKSADKDEGFTDWVKLDQLYTIS